MPDLSDAQLADLGAKAKVAAEESESWFTVQDCTWAEPGDAEFIAAASPDVVLALLGVLKGARAALDRVKTLHHTQNPGEATAGAVTVCVECATEWPCPTVRAIEQAGE